MYTDKEQKHLNKIIEGSPVRFSFPVTLDNAKLKGNYTITLDKMHLFGSLGSLEPDNDLKDFAPNSANLNRLLSGDFMPLFSVDAKGLRKALRSFKYTDDSKFWIGHVARFHNDQLVDIPNTTLLNKGREFNLGFVKSQWMNILSLMEGQIEVGIHLGKDSMWYFIQQDSARFGTSMLMNHDLKHIAEYNLDVFVYEAEQEFKAQNKTLPGGSTLYYDDMRLVAKNTDWKAYFNCGYTPYSAAYDRWQRYRQLPKTFKADKVIMAWRSGKAHYYIRKNGKVRHYITHYRKDRKIEVILKFWGYTESRRYNRRVYTAPQPVD